MLVAPYCLLSQSLHTTISSEEAKEIVIEESGIYASTKDILDTITVDPRNNDIIYYYSNDVKSFWYKIYVRVDAKITFDIYSSNHGNRYNYFLYQRSGDLNINEISTTDIEPVRASLYEDNMDNGTGLSLSSMVSSNDSCPQDINQIWRHTPYQAAIDACSGDVLLLNIYHVSGSDCGQHLILKDDKHAHEFQSIYESCYNEQMALKKLGHFTNMDIVGKTGKAKESLIVKDRIIDHKMEGEIAEVHQSKELDSIIHSETNGFNEITSIYGSIPDSLLKAEQLVASITTNQKVKIEVPKHTSRIKKIETPYVNKEEDKLATAGMLSGSSKKLPNSIANNTTENDFKITDVIIGTSISGFVLLILFLALLDRKNRKEQHSNQVV